MQQTAASIAIANKSAPITSPTISSESGEIAAARHGITFFSDPYSSGKCEWARTSQILVHAPPRPKNLLRLQEQLVLRLKELQLRRLLHQQLHLRPAVRRQRRLRRHPGLRLPMRLRQMHHRRRVSGLALLLHHPDKWRTLLLAEAVLPHRARRLPARHIQSRPPVCRRCILPPGIMCICLRRAASILIQTCRRTVFSTENDA